MLAMNPSGQGMLSWIERPGWLNLAMCFVNNSDYLEVLAWRSRDLGWALVPISLSTPAGTRVRRIELCVVHGVAASLVHIIICVVSFDVATAWVEVARGGA